MENKPQDDGQVDGYSRVVNGKVVRVNAYGKKPTSSQNAAVAVRKLPGRPRMAASPGTYSGGRSIPGQKFVVPRPPQEKGAPGEPPRGR